MQYRKKETLFLMRIEPRFLGLSTRSLVTIMSEVLVIYSPGADRVGNVYSIIACSLAGKRVHRAVP
jgi:hypothetical protein